MEARNGRLQSIKELSIAKLLMFLLLLHLSLNCALAHSNASQWVELSVTKSIQNGAESIMKPEDSQRSPNERLTRTPDKTYPELNSTNSKQRSGRSSSQLLLLFALLALINLIVILGNILVIIAVYATAKLRNVTNIFIVSLATADLLLGIFVLPYAMLLEVLDVWMFGEHWCRGWLVTDVWISTASILNLCAISIDRYVAVTRPVKYRSIMTARRAKTIVAGVWLVSFLICFPPLLPMDWSLAAYLEPTNRLNTRPGDSRRLANESEPLKQVQIIATLDSPLQVTADRPKRDTRGQLDEIRRQVEFAIETSDRRQASQLALTNVKLALHLAELINSSMACKLTAVEQISIRLTNFIPADGGQKPSGRSLALTQLAGIETPPIELTLGPAELRMLARHKPKTTDLSSPELQDSPAQSNSKLALNDTSSDLAAGTPGDKDIDYASNYSSGRSQIAAVAQPKVAESAATNLEMDFLAQGNGMKQRREIMRTDTGVAMVGLKSLTSTGDSTKGLAAFLFQSRPKNLKASTMSQICAKIKLTTRSAAQISARTKTTRSQEKPEAHWTRGSGLKGANRQAATMEVPTYEIIRPNDYSADKEILELSEAAKRPEDKNIAYQFAPLSLLLLSSGYCDLRQLKELANQKELEARGGLDARDQLKTKTRSTNPPHEDTKQLLSSTLASDLLQVIDSSEQTEFRANLGRDERIQVYFNNLMGQDSRGPVFICLAILKSADVCQVQCQLNSSANATSVRLLNPTSQVTAGYRRQMLRVRRSSSSNNNEFAQTHSSLDPSSGQLKSVDSTSGPSNQNQGCTLFHEKTYVIYSALGSFYIPMLFMIFFYSRIYLVASRAQKAMQRGYVTTKWPRGASGSGSGFRGPIGSSRYENHSLTRSSKSSGKGSSLACNGIGDEDERVTLRIHRREKGSAPATTPAAPPATITTILHTESPDKQPNESLASSGSRPIINTKIELSQQMSLPTADTQQIEPVKVKESDRKHQDESIIPKPEGPDIIIENSCAQEADSPQGELEQVSKYRHKKHQKHHSSHCQKHRHKHNHHHHHHHRRTHQPACKHHSREMQNSSLDSRDFGASHWSSCRFNAHREVDVKSEARDLDLSTLTTDSANINNELANNVISQADSISHNDSSQSKGLELQESQFAMKEKRAIQSCDHRTAQNEAKFHIDTQLADSESSLRTNESNSVRPIVGLNDDDVPFAASLSSATNNRHPDSCQWQGDEKTPDANHIQITVSHYEDGENSQESKVDLRQNESHTNTSTKSSLIDATSGHRFNLNSITQSAGKKIGLTSSRGSSKCDRSQSVDVHVGRLNDTINENAKEETQFTPDGPQNKRADRSHSQGPSPSIVVEWDPQSRQTATRLREPLSATCSGPEAFCTGVSSSMNASQASGISLMANLPQAASQVRKQSMMLLNSITSKGSITLRRLSMVAAHPVDSLLRSRSRCDSTSGSSDCDQSGENKSTEICKDDLEEEKTRRSKRRKKRKATKRSSTPAEQKKTLDDYLMAVAGIDGSSDEDEAEGPSFDDYDDSSDTEVSEHPVRYSLLMAGENLVRSIPTINIIPHETFIQEMGDQRDEQIYLAIDKPLISEKDDTQEGANESDTPLGQVKSEISDQVEQKVESPSPRPKSSGGLHRQGAYYERATSRSSTAEPTDCLIKDFRSTSFLNPQMESKVAFWRGSGKSKQMIVSSTGPTGESSITKLVPVPGRRRAAKRTTRWHAKRLRAETKAAKTVAIIIGGFIFCWLPFFTAYLSRAIICEQPDCIPQSLLSLFIWLGYLNSAINPVIYGLFSADFRTAFKNILCRCKLRNNDDTAVVSVLVDSIIKSIL